MQVVIMNNTFYHIKNKIERILNNKIDITITLQIIRGQEKPYTFQYVSILHLYFTFWLISLQHRISAHFVIFIVILSVYYCSRLYYLLIIPVKSNGKNKFIALGMLYNFCLFTATIAMSSANPTMSSPCLSQLDLHSHHRLHCVYSK